MSPLGTQPAQRETALKAPFSLRTIKDPVRRRL